MYKLAQKKADKFSPEEIICGKNINQEGEGENMNLKFNIHPCISRVLPKVPTGNKQSLIQNNEPCCLFI